MVEINTLQFTIDGVDHQIYGDINSIRQLIEVFRAAADTNFSIGATIYISRPVPDEEVNL